MGRRRGSGKVARMLKRTKSGNRIKRRHVKLDTKGITKFLATFGTGKTQGITFSMGLFSPKAATKGLWLEFGTDNQVARPWLSSVLSPNSSSQRRVIKEIGKFARAAFSGKDRKKETRRNLVKILQEHLYEQRFQATKLTDSTIRQKRAKGSSEPHLIGIDTFDLATKLDVRTKGSLNRKIRGA